MVKVANGIKTAAGFIKDHADEIGTAIQWVKDFLEDHKDTIAKVTPWIGKLALAFLGLKAVNTVAPGLTSFAGGLLKLAGKGIESCAMDTRTIGYCGDGGFLPEGGEGKCQGGDSSTEGVQAIAPFVCGIESGKSQACGDGRCTREMFFQYPLEIPCMWRKIFLPIAENSAIKT